MPSGVYKRTEEHLKLLKKQGLTIQKIGHKIASRLPRSNKQIEHCRRISVVALKIAHQNLRVHPTLKQIKQRKNFLAKGLIIAHSIPRSQKQLEHNHNKGMYKSGRYKGYYWRGSWELAFIIYHLDHDLFFERNIKWFPYFFSGKMRRFYPDFLKNGKFIEIKGQITEADKEKIKQFPYAITVIHTKEILPYLKYCEERYGKNWIERFKK